MPPQLVEWFRDDPLPDFVPTPTIIVGGRRLLKEFMRQTALIGGDGVLAIAAGSLSADGLRLACDWTALDHSTLDLHLATSGERSAKDAERELGGFPWRSLHIRQSEGLHSKVYSFLSGTGASVCLIGSHNVSRSAMFTNTEAGLLALSYSPSWLTGIAAACCSYVAGIEDS